MEFQVKGFNLLVSKDFLILADDAGLGKSWMVANAIEARKRLGQLERGVVVAKASLLYNWRDEILKHTNLKPVVMTGTIKQRSKLYSDLSHGVIDWDVIIISYETYRVDIGNIALLGKFKPMQFLVLDEAHKVKNPNSSIGNRIHMLDFKIKYILTATPLPNSPLEAYNYLKLGKRINMNWWQFEARYAIKGGYNNKEILAFKNIQELKRLIQVNMLRRRKKDKLKELPDITFKTIKVEMTPEQKRMYTAVKHEIMEELKDTSLDRIPSALTKLLRLQQITDSLELIGVPGRESSAKLNALDDLLESLVDEGGEKVIIFSRFRSMVDILAKRYAKYNPAIIHGDVDTKGLSESSALKALKKKYGKEWREFSEEQKHKLLEEAMTSDRQKEVYKFQNDDSCRIFIGTSPACREGLTLTKATHVIFLDLEWSYAYVEQAYSRAHRIGQKNAVTVYYLVCSDTIDEHVQDIINRKETMAQAMLEDGRSIDLGVAKQIIARMAGL